MVTICTTSLTFSNSTFWPHSVFVFCVDLRTNSDYFPIQHKLAGFYEQNLTLYGPVVTICTTSLTFNNSTFCPLSVFMCFVWISEQTAIISLYSINWLYPSLTFNNSMFCPLSVFMCFVWIWEQRTIISLDNVNWLHHQFNVQQVCFLSIQCIYVFCVDLTLKFAYKNSLRYKLLKMDASNRLSLSQSSAECIWNSSIR